MINGNPHLDDVENQQKHSSDQYIIELFQPILKIKDYVEYIKAQNTIARQQQDYYLQQVLPELKGKILEMGATPKRDYLEWTVDIEEYIKTNLYPKDESILKVDATDINMPDNSVDGIICVSVLEHIEDFRTVISEFYRILKPGGKLVFSVPFVYYYHGAPDDYYRFTVSALKHLLKDFYKVKISAIGNHWDNIAHMLQGPDWVNKKRRFSPLPLRLLGLPFYIIGRYKKAPDNYALLYGIVAEK